MTYPAGSCDVAVIGAGHAGIGAVGYQATAAAAAAKASVIALYNDMAEFSGESVMAVDKLSVDYDSGTDTGAKRNHDEVFQAAGGAIGHLADSGGVGVIGDGDRNTEFIADKLSQGYGCGPGEVHTAFDGSRIIVGVGGADTDTVDFPDSVIGFQQLGKFSMEFVEICFNRAMFAGLD